jgi:hypothetical protein
MIVFEVGDRDYNQAKSEKHHNKDRAASVSTVRSDCAFPSNFYMKNRFRQSLKEALSSSNPRHHNINVQHPDL